MPLSKKLGQRANSQLYKTSSKFMINKEDDFNLETEEKRILVELKNY